MGEQLRQYISADSPLHPYLATTPLPAEAVGEAIDFEVLSRQRRAWQQSQPEWVYKQSPAEAVLRREREIANSLAIKKQYEENLAKQREFQQREQAQRNELARRVSGENAPQTQQRIPTAEVNDRLRPYLAERQRPSTAAPPPTPNDTAARASSLVEPTAMPRSAKPMEAISNNAIATGAIASGGALLKSLPQAAGRLAVPGVYAAYDFGSRVIAGQPVAQAAGSALITGGLSVVGGVIGTVFGGPIVGAVGSLVGGFIAGQINNLLFPPLSPSEPPNQSYQGLPPWKGGYLYNQLYAAIFNTTTDAQITSYKNGSASSLTSVAGRITNISAPSYFNAGYGNAAFTRYTITSTAPNGTTTTTSVQSESVTYIGPNTVFPQIKGFVLINQNNTGITDFDPPLGAVQPDTRTPASVQHPGNQEWGVANGTPAATSKNPSPNNYAPGKVQIDASPRGDTNNWVPHGGLAPRITPNPTTTPSNLGGNLPTQGLIPTPVAFAEPKDAPKPRLGVTITPSSGGIIVPTVVQGTPGIVTPVTRTYSEGTDANGNYYAPDGSITAPNGTKLRVADKDQKWTDVQMPLDSPPAGIAQTSPSQPTPDGVSKISKAYTSPVPKTPEQQQADEDSKKFKDLNDQIAGLATTLALLTPLINKIPQDIANNPDIRQARKDDVKGAVCDIAQPGGCLGNKFDQQNQQNNNNFNNLGSKLDALNLGANAADLALLGIINNKLGDQIPGGLSGHLVKFTKWQAIDRIVNLVTMAAAIHNVVMLSDQAAQTFFSILDNLLAIPTLIVNPDGDTINTQEAFSGAIENIMKSVFGVQEWAEIKKKWQLYNRIYQAGANGINEVRNIGSSIVSAVEQTARLTGKGFNAMLDEGLLSELNWDYTPEDLKLKGGLYAKLGKLANGINIVTEGLEAIESITSEVRSAVESANQIKQESQEIENAVKELIGASKTKREQEVEALPAKSYSWEDLM